MNPILANLRWQPAIPAVAVMLLMVVMPVSVLGNAELSRLLQIMVPIGIVLSCGLAIAAGFCSLAPQILWGLLAVLCLRYLSDTGAPALFGNLLMLGCVAVGIMFVVQIWRVKTGRFVPTIENDANDQN